MGSSPAPDPRDERDLEEPLEDPLEPSSPGRAGSPVLPDLSSLPIAGLTRRRLGLLAGGLVSAWIVIVFARQVGEAGAATARVEELRSANQAVAGRLAALQREAGVIQREEWVAQQARAYRLGSSGDIPFTLGDAPPLPPDAPGSAAARLGADTTSRSPLESWLSLLFGPSH